MIEIQKISKIYDKNTIALNNITLSLPDKGLVFITGSSGSGKSTMLNLLGLLDNPSEGEIIVDGKFINKLKQKEIDYYRNTYIGFVFQEYNLLNNYNVRKNVEIALDLQKKKYKKEKILEILKSVGLDGLDNRKINELSGGQKQRVAIARALIKNPNIILADEPTGNLDYENSEQIFSILKNISTNKLVIVVTHNLEFADKYGDRVIELKDGIVISDSINNNYIGESKTFSIVKSKLSFWKSLQLALGNLKKKKLKLLVSTLLIIISLSIFAFFYNFTSFDINRTHAETMISQNETNIEIHKKIEGKNFTIESPVITFTNNELNELKSSLNRKFTKVSKVNEYNFYLSIHYAEINPIEHKNNYAYYNLNQSYTLFLEYDLDELNQLRIIGNLPSKENEILINKVLADFIIYNGITILEKNKDGIYESKDFFPTTYKEIVNSNSKVQFGSTYLVISGIIDDDMSMYENLKTTLDVEMEINPTNIYNDYKTKYSSKLNEVIVANDFFDKTKFSSNNVLPVDFYKIAYSFNGNSFYPIESTAVINKKIKAYDGSKYFETDILNQNEIIIGITILDEIYNNEYSNNYLEELKKAKDKYDKKVKERNKKIEVIEKELEKNPEYIYEYPDEIEAIDINKFNKEYFEKFISSKDIIGKSISIDISDLYLRTQDEKTKRYEDFVIVGCLSEDTNNYFSSESVLNQYMRENVEIISIYFNEKNKEKLIDIFNKFPNDKSKYVVKTIYSDTISDVKNVVDNISSISIYCVIFSLVFAIVLFMFFTILSVNSNKKDIGILRALGAKTKDIYKIFYLETFLMGLFSSLLSIIIAYISVDMANVLISQRLFVNVKPIIFKFDIIYTLPLVLLLLTLLSFVIPLFKISKTKPIDIINNK